MSEDLKNMDETVTEPVMSEELKNIDETATEPVMSEELKNMDETVTEATVDIKQELRDDIQSMIENIEEEYDDEIVIDDDDVCDFLSEHSGSSGETNLAEIVPKVEP